jgi:hypothetical protein
MINSRGTYVHSSVARIATRPGPSLLLQCSIVATVKPENFLHAPGQGQGSLGPGYAPVCTYTLQRSYLVEISIIRYSLLYQYK